MRQPVGRVHQASPSRAFLIPPRCLARQGSRQYLPPFSAQPGALRSAKILKLTQEIVLNPSERPNASPGWELGASGGSSRTG